MSDDRLLKGGNCYCESGGGGPVVSDLALTTTAIDATDQTVYTFSGLNIEAPHANRLIIAALVYRAATAVTLTSIVIGGVTAAIDAEARNTSSGVSSAVIAHAAVPTGETADVVVTLSGAASRAAVSLFSTSTYDGAAATETGTATRAATPGTMSPNLAAADKGFVVGCAYSAGGASQKISVGIANLAAGAQTLTVNCQSGTSDWTVGLTDLIDAQIEAGAAATVMAAASAGWKYP